jgi:hypothetical protein
MERLFSRCTRYQQIFESRVVHNNPELLWWELNLDVATEEFLSAEKAFTYADLYAMLGNEEDTVAWLTPHASVMRVEGLVQDFLDLMRRGACQYSFTADGKQVHAVAHSSEALSEIVDVVLRLLAASVVHSVILDQSISDDVFINAPTLAYLMEQCQSLKLLTLKNVEMDEDHCRVLDGALSRPGLEITLKKCLITDAAATVMAEVLGRNQGPTKLDRCTIDNVVLADGLRGNSRLKSLSPVLSSHHASQEEVFAIAGALKENKGLVKLNLHYVITAVNDKMWEAVCDSLKTHPTLQVLNLWGYERAPLTASRLEARIQSLANMLKVNISIHTIHLPRCYSGHELIRESVTPYLTTNRLRLRVRAIQKARQMLYRAKVLGRALLSTRTDANSFWMLLSGNAEVAFPSTTTPTANLPVPVTAAATVNVAAVAATRAASRASASAAANVATPTTCQKRKAHP